MVLEIRKGSESYTEDPLVMASVGTGLELQRSMAIFGDKWGLEFSQCANLIIQR